MSEQSQVDYEESIKKELEANPESPGEDKKYTDWANEPTVDQLKQNITDTDANDQTHIRNVERWLSNLYIVDSAKTNNKKSSNLQPKLIRKQAEWRYASLSEPFLASPDLYNIYPVSAGDTKRATQNALVLNNQFNTKIKKVKFIDDYVREAVDIGTVAVKVGWHSAEQEVEREEPVFEFIPEPTGQLAQRYDWLLQLKAENNEEYYNWIKPGVEEALAIYMLQGVATIPTPTGEVEIIKELVEIANHPTVETVDTRNLIIDPTCGGDYEKAKFIAERFKSSKAELEVDGNYFNLDKIQTDSAAPATDPDYEEKDYVNSENNNFNFVDTPRKKFIVTIYWGEWDIHGDGTTRAIVAAWVNDVMVRLEENPFPDKKPPYVLEVYMPVRGSVYGEPDGELLEDNQKVVGAVSRGMIDLMAKSANAQTGMRADMLDVANRRKFLDGKDYEFNASVDVRQGIHQHTFPEIPQSAYNMIIMQNNEAESLSGIKAFTSGITGDALGKSVANGRSALDAASKREVGIVRRLANGLIHVGRKIVAMNAEFLSEEEVVRITADEFVTVRRDDLAGNFDLEMAISTPEEDNRKAEELAFMLQTDTNNADPVERRMIRAKIARLRKMPDLAKQIEEYEPQPDPLQVAKAEKEIVLLDATIAKEQALAMKHAAEAEAAGDRGAKDRTQAALNLSKAGEADAKAGDYRATADKKNLDYVEQETGTTQERELEKLDRKGINDLKGKVVDGAMKAESEKNKPKPSSAQSK
jgi:hypothetical protein